MSFTVLEQFAIKTNLGTPGKLTTYVLQKLALTHFALIPLTITDILAHCASRFFHKILARFNCNRATRQQLMN